MSNDMTDKQIIVGEIAMLIAILDDKKSRWIGSFGDELNFEFREYTQSLAEQQVNDAVVLVNVDNDIKQHFGLFGVIVEVPFNNQDDDYLSMGYDRQVRADASLVLFDSGKVAITQAIVGTGDDLEFPDIETIDKLIVALS